VDASVGRFAYHVFLSHNGSEKEWVRGLAKRLRDSGLRVFFDEDSVALGEDIVTSIERGLRLSRHILLVLSPQALSSQWVALEWATTIYRDPDAAQRTLIPILRKECDIPLPLARLKRLDATGANWDAQLQQLLASIDRESVALKSTESSPIIPAPTRVPTTPAPTRMLANQHWLPAPGGALPLNSPVYIHRRADSELENLVAVETGVLGVQGCRQAGKSSLVLRALHKAGATRTVVRVDLSSYGVSNLHQLLSAVSKKIAEVHNIPAPDLTRDDFRDYLQQFEEFLLTLPKPTIVALDEFDFIRAIGEDRHWPAPNARPGTILLHFLRSWHDGSAFRRGLEVGQVLFVLCSFLTFHDLTGDFVSPFNVGPEVRLGNFSKEEIAGLLQIYRLTPNDREISDLLRFTGGQPFLVHQCAHLLVRDARVADLITQETQFDERFGRHLLPLVQIMESVGIRDERWTLTKQPPLSRAKPSPLLELKRIGSRGVAAESLRHHELFRLLGILSNATRERSQIVDRIFSRLDMLLPSRDRVDFACGLYRGYFGRR
jgi:TIR domain/AAA-like domain